MRLIDADPLYKQITELEELARNRVLDTESASPYPNNLNPSYTRYLSQMDERMKFKELVADAPTIKPERKRGRLEYVDYGGFGNWHCTACRQIIICNGDYDFCPYCGADLKEGEQK